MHLVNESHWDTKDLRKLCQAIIKHVGSHKDHFITVVTRRSRWDKTNYGGQATVCGSRITMRVPLTEAVFRWIPVYHPTETTIGSDGRVNPKIIRYDKPLTPIPFEPITFARVLEHEIAHNLGIGGHKDMRNTWKRPVEEFDYVKGFVVRPKEKKESPVRDLKEERRQHALMMLTRHSRALMREQRLVKKWQRKMAYYNRGGADGKAD